MEQELRSQLFRKLFPQAPRYRLDQMHAAQFTRGWKSWNDATMFSKEMRDALSHGIPWVSYISSKVLESKKKDTYKALLELFDGKKIETVLMLNRKNNWTICVSSQVGCAMRCGFCATGKMGFTRNMTSDEIVDQYRFWMNFLFEHPGLDQKISNIVFMGMGEPLANYENVKSAIHALLKYAVIGETHITVSTVGILPVMEKILEDKDWPRVRLAVSLHSADPVTRKNIVPTSFEDFLPKLANWSKRYLKKFGNRSHHLTYEYVMLAGVNDSLVDAKKLANFVTTTGKIKVNLIPYNFTDSEFQKTPDEQTQKFLEYLHKHTVIATTRRTMGEDIAAACGQLIVSEKKSDSL